MFSVSTLTQEEARLTAQAYLKAGRNPNRIASVLGCAEFDRTLLAHPLVRREIVKMARINAESYSLEDHLEKLAEIRNAALEDGKYSAALGAELSIGKASGLYDKGRGDEDPMDGTIDATKMTSEQIRTLLLRRGAAQEALPAPRRKEEDAEDVLEDDYVPPSDMNEDGLP